MIKIAICDDEEWCRKELQEYCQKYFEEACLEYRIMKYASGEELQKEMLGRECVADVLLLDIEMKGLDGIQLKDALQKERRNIRILFVTNHGEAMPEAFGSHVFGFLKKPVEYEIFSKKMHLVIEDIRDCEKYVIVKNTSGTRKIYLNQIRYIQANGKYTQMFLADEDSCIFCEQSIGNWKEALEPEGFSQCHKSYLVNFHHLKSIKENILLRDNTSIPLSRRMKKACREQYKKYLWSRAK